MLHNSSAHLRPISLSLRPAFSSRGSLTPCRSVRATRWSSHNDTQEGPVAREAVRRSSKPGPVPRTAPADAGSGAPAGGLSGHAKRGSLTPGDFPGAEAPPVKSTQWPRRFTSSSRNSSSGSSSSTNDKDAAASPAAASPDLPEFGIPVVKRTFTTQWPSRFNSSNSSVAINGSNVSSGVSSGGGSSSSGGSGSSSDLHALRVAPQEHSTQAPRRASLSKRSSATFGAAKVVQELEEAFAGVTDYRHVSVLPSDQVKLDASTSAPECIAAAPNIGSNSNTDVATTIAAASATARASWPGPAESKAPFVGPASTAHWPLRLANVNSGRSSCRTSGSSSSSSSNNNVTTKLNRRSPTNTSARPTAQERSYQSSGRIVLVQELNDKIGVAQTVQDLAACVASHSGVVDERHVSAALSRLVKLREFASAPGVVAVAAAQLMERLLQMLMEAPAAGQPLRIESLNSRGLVNTLWAVVAGMREDHPACPRLLARLCANKHQALAACNAQELSNLAWAAAKAGERSPGAGLRDEEVSGLFHAIAMAGVRGAGSPRNGQDVANLLWAFAKVGCVEPCVVQPLWDQVGRMDVAAFNGQELSSVLWALASTCWQPAIGQRLCDHLCRTNLAACDPQLISNASWALATGGHVDRPFMSALCGAALQQGLLSWNAQDLANMVWALATLSVESKPAPSEQQATVQGAYLDAVVQQVLRGGMGKANCQEWGNLLWGFATLRHSAPALFMGAVGLMQPSLSCFDIQASANVVWAYAVAAPPAGLTNLVDTWEEHLHCQLDRCDPQALSNIGWSLAVAGGVESDLSRRGQLARALLTEAGQRDVSSFSDADLTQLHQLCVEVCRGSVLRGCNLVPLQLWEMLCEARAGKLSICDASDVQRDVSALLRRMGIDSLLEQPSPCGYFSVDVEVRLPQTAAVGLASCVVALEVDGPTHFMTNDAALHDGASRLRDRQLSRSYGRAVVTVSVMTDWVPKSFEERERMLRERLGLQGPPSRRPKGLRG